MACETICTFFTFFSKSKKHDFLRFFGVVAHVFPNSDSQYARCHRQNDCPNRNVFACFLHGSRKRSGRSGFGRTTNFQSTVSNDRRLNSFTSTVTKIHKTVATRAAPFGPDMQQIVCQLGLRPRPHWGAYSAPQTS